ncbi:putative toxin-antitoxin system, toxin component [Nocardioidaceae bacterium Broad-1]|nr:putative toxin-antitoxin system, toxin component [Nocardioidaceae bacterium Broad-1]
MPRGFKAEAERTAERIRAELNLAPDAALPAGQLTEYMGIRLVSAETLVDRSRLEELERLQAFSFSAVTFDVQDRKIIVTNPLRTKERMASDVAHEVSHVLLKHKLSEVREVEGVPFRTCQPAEEEQATALGGALLLPRKLLLAAARRRLTPEAIAAEYGVTVDMARFRYNTTGVGRQARAATAS